MKGAFFRSYNVADIKKGWVRLFRSIQDHDLWKHKPYDKARAWVDLILTANHRNNRLLVGNQFIEIKRGEMLTSQLKLSKRWGWSREKVNNFLKLLSIENQLSLKTHIQKDKGFTLITLLNYNKLQERDNVKPTTKPTTNRQLTDNKPYTNKNVKNVKNDKNNTIHSIFDYFLLKTKKAFKFTKDRQILINKRLGEGYTVAEIKTAIDHFVIDDWPDRYKYMDLEYCIGTRNKVNLLDKWINRKIDPLEKWRKR